MNPGKQEPKIGHLTFDLGEIPADPSSKSAETIDFQRRIASSALIKLVTDTAPPDPSEVTERDLRVMSPNQISSGLYVPEARSPQDTPNSFKGVVFPADQFLVIARSPSDLARHTRTRTLRAHERTDDKYQADQSANRAAGHVLKSHLSKISTLETSLHNEEEKAALFSRELHGARGTGYYSHHSFEKLQPIKASVESAIFDALNVAATTHKWDKEKTERARKTILYQLYGIDSRRVKNWIGYTDVVKNYAHARGIVIAQARRSVATELAQYQPFLDAKEN